MLSLCMAMLDEPEDKAEFERAYNIYRGKMLSLAYGIIGNYHDAEEAVSSAFFAIAKNYTKLKKRSGQERAAFYCVVTKNCSYSILRKQSRKMEIPIDEDEELIDMDSDVSDEVLSDIGYERVVAAIKALPEIYAQALYLRNVTGLSVKEIAHALGESENTISKRLERAKSKLRNVLENQGISID